MKSGMSRIYHSLNSKRLILFAVTGILQFWPLAALFENITKLILIVLKNKQKNQTTYY